LERAEIKKVALELGKTLSENELNKTMKIIDTNGDGKISFEEFYVWWHHGVTNKLEELVYIRMKSMKI
jgi:Ca2+-binding EF-hand superfamily protein